MSNWVGKTLGKVYIESLLARGGMAEVYLGTHSTLQREVVVKILRNYEDDNLVLLDRFQREARVVAKLRHANIVQVFDFDTFENQPYIVMEYIPGPSLSKYLNILHAKIGRLELPLISRLLTGIASALQYAHESGVVHRDVKPGNILLISRSSQIVPGEPLPTDFEPVLTDFGLVRMLSASHQTTVGHIAGTPAYMSPEQARGEQVDGRTDIYSLGIILYEILAGHVPFDGDTTMSVLLKHVNEPPAPIPGLSEPLQKVLDRALAKNVAKRFQTPSELATAFNAVMDERAIASTVEPKTPISTSRARKTLDRAQLRRKRIGATLAGVAILVMGSFLLLSKPAPQETATPTVSQTVPPKTETPVIIISSPLGPTGVLRFQDGKAIADQVTLTAFAMPAPPADGQYEVWLVNEEERLSLGMLVLDENGKGTLTFDDTQNRNLVAIYDGVELTIKPNTDSTPEASRQIAYSYTLPEDGLQYVRRLLVSFPMTPEQVALIQGISANTRLLDQASREMLGTYGIGDNSGTKHIAEAIMNILVGAESQEHKDWNGDGQVIDPGDGYGLLLNGDNLGYIQAVYSHADYAVNSPGASQNMIANGESLKTCAQNLAQWATQLRDLSLTIFTSGPSDLGQPVRDSAALANKMLNGLDIDSDGKVEPVSSECGVLTGYEHAYRMVDMPLLPVNLLDTPTPTATSSTSVGPTNASVQPPTTSQNTLAPPPNNNPGNPNPTKKPPKPTKTPKK